MTTLSLLEHNLRGDLFESTGVGSLAVLSIDANKGILKEAYYYMPSLSSFIKIAQMFNIEKAVVATREGSVS